jgi:hypothetical protein
MEQERTSDEQLNHPYPPSSFLTLPKISGDARDI